jgi:hypothetical protein
LDSIQHDADKAVSAGDHKKIWSLRKKYHQTEFEPDSSSIGYEIEVYQDSINKSTREFLVNFDYLTQLLENYGFDLVTPEEAASTLSEPMPDGTGTFDGLFHQMELDVKRARETGGGGGGARFDEFGSARTMRPEEKRISFYNRYFIFRKNRNINAKQLKNSFLSYAGLQEEQEREGEARGGLDESVEASAIEKIKRASMPIDVATKPAIAAGILKKNEEDKIQKQLDEGVFTSSSGSGAAASVPKRKLTVKTSTLKRLNAALDEERKNKAEHDELMKELGMDSAPIEQIEKKIKKQTRKATTGGIIESDLDIQFANALAETGKGQENPQSGPLGMANPLKPKTNPKPKPKLVVKTEKNSSASSGAEAIGGNADKQGKKTRRKKED